MARRRVLVRRSRIHSPGKETNRIESARALGVRPTGPRANVYDPSVERILALPLSRATEHGIDKRNFARLRRRLRNPKSVRTYQGGLLQRIRQELSRNRVAAADDWAAAPSRRERT